MIRINMEAWEPYVAQPGYDTRHKDCAFLLQCLREAYGYMDTAIYSLETMIDEAPHKNRNPRLQEIADSLKDYH